MHSEFEHFTCYRSVGAGKLDQYIDILRQLHKTVEDEELTDRLRCLVTVLVTQNIEHRDSLDGK